MLDPALAQLYQMRCGKSDAEIIRSGVGKESLKRIKMGQQVWLDTAVKYQVAVNAPDLLALLPAEDVLTFANAFNRANAIPGLASWMIDKHQGGEVRTSNGLKYFVWKLKQRHETDRFARAKQYELAGVATQDRERMIYLLSRHSKVCNLLSENGHSPKHILPHITTEYDSLRDAWWIVDEWVDGPTLHEMIDDHLLSPSVLPRVMREVAEGLKTLHDHNIIRRELSPKTIFVGNTVQLTDFELGKLFDGEPTVGKNLTPNPYRAPEIGKQPLVKGDEHVDLYSWGRILLKASTGSLPNETKKAIESFDDAPLPSRVREIGKQCLMPVEKGRPRTADEVLKAIRGWK